MMKPAVNSNCNRGGNLKKELQQTMIPTGNGNSVESVTKPMLAAFRARIRATKKTIWNNG
jgi:hypothetical protein